MSTGIVNNAINQDPPYDMMEEYQLYVALIDYLSNRAQDNVSILTAEEGVYRNTLTEKIYFKLSGFRNFLIRRGLYGKDLNNWQLGNKLNELEIPTDEVDFSSETRVKRKVNVQSEYLKVNSKTEYLRSLPLEEVPISEGLREAVEGVL